MGKPLKDRGIHWEEQYGEKSAYLKEEYEKQVGPGSYFRWEGHDSASGEDYYVVVTPGFSKKKGYHFFAALRKMPANDGASGKKFKTQAEALSHAFRTWKVPPPKTKPHKPYIAKDLEGKPIVTENIHHAGVEHAVVRIGNRIIIDATLKTAGLNTKGVGDGPAFPHMGEKDAGTYGRDVAIAMLGMGIGAASCITTQVLTIDAKGQSGKVFHPDGKQVGPEESNYVGVASCAPPTEAVWNAVMSGTFRISQPLFNIRQDNNEKFHFTPKDVLGQPGGKVLNFSKIMVVKTVAKVSAANKGKFDERLGSMIANLKSVLSPETPIRIVPNQDGSKEKLEGRTLYINLECPIDTYPALQSIMAKEKIGQIAELKNANDRNAMKLYSYFLQSGMLSPDKIEEAKNTPAIEEVSITKNQMIFYDEMGWPVGIRMRKVSGVKEGGMPDDVDNSPYFVFKSGLVEGWLQLPEVKGNLVALRKMLMHNRIPIRREDTVDARTCAPVTRPVMGNFPVIKNKIPTTGEDGTLAKPRRAMFDPFPLKPGPKNMVRMFNQETNREEVVPLPEWAVREQQIDGLPVVLEDKKSFFYLPDRNDNPVPFEAGQISLYDPSSKGKMKSGNAFYLINRPDDSTATKKNVGRRQKSLENNGFFVASRKHMGGLAFKNMTNATGRMGNVKSIKDDHLDSLFSIMTPQGRMDVPQGWQKVNDPEKQNDPDVLKLKSNPAVQYLLNPSSLIGGYYYVTNKAFTAESLLGTDEEIKQPYMIRTPEGLVEDKSRSPLVITPDDLKVVPGRTRKNVYFKEQAKGREYTKAKFGIEDFILGSPLDCSNEDLNALDQMANKIYAKTDAERTPDERLFLAVIDAGDTPPPELLALMSKIDPNDPSQFTYKTGTAYEIQMIGQLPAGAPPKLREYLDGVQSEIFATEETAQPLIDYAVNEAAAAKINLEGQLVINKVENAPLLPSRLRAMRAGLQPQPLVTDEDRKIMGMDFAQIGTGIIEEVPDEPVAPVAPDAVTPPAAPAEELVEPEDYVEPAPLAPAPAPIPQPVAPAEELVEPEEYVEPAPPAPPPVKPKRRNPLAPMSEQMPPITSQSIESLVAYANDLDRRGMHERADAIDTVLKKFCEKGVKGIEGATRIK